MSTGSNSAINPSGNWTQTLYDGLSRVKTVTTPDSAVATTSYSGNTETVTDQQGKAKRSVTDALGRLTQIIEDPGTTGHFNYQTTYTYDALDNLRWVQQGAQNRYFMYDSLSRLIRAKIPEQAVNISLPFLNDPVTSNSQWANSYTYEANGNLSTKTDARNIKATFVYDGLNRVITRSYDDGITPAANFYYDGATLGKGRLWQTITTGANNQYQAIDSYDAMGRILSQRQQFLYNGAWSQSYTVQRTYDLAGHTLTQNYPSGHTVTYTYDAAGRTQSLNGTLGEGTARTYSTGITYNEWSALNHEQYGTQTLLYHNRRYNLRGQLYDVRVGSGADNSSDATWNRGCLQFYYSSNNVWGGSGTDNNGNLLKTINYVPANDAISSSSTHTDDYGYDALNRLSLVNDFDGSTQTGSQHYDFDQFGNRTINAGTTWGTGINKQQFTVDASTNRLGAPGGQAGVMNYDAAGNLYNDTYTGLGARTFDAENRMTSATDSSYSTSYYIYDADGRRVRRRTGAEVWQIYGVDGELLSEYAATAAPSTPQKEYGYRNGELLVSASNTAPVDLALNKSVTQSSTFSNFPASLAVDGNINGDFNGAHTSSATNYSYQPWWQLDLGSSQSINSIKLYPRTDCCPEMLANAYLFVSEQPFTSTDLSATLAQAGVSSYVITGNTSAATSVNVNRAGRYIRVQRSDTQYLVLAEVQVWGQQSSAVADVEWLVSDQLGTPRIVLDQSGSLSGVKRHDYLPFGEELYAGTGGRSAQQGYNGDNVSQKFTGKIRDVETGMDYFGARYYGSTQGRFTSPDPLFASGRGANPQTWNRYAYVLNNPLALVDPTGLIVANAAQHKKGTKQTQQPRTIYVFVTFDKDEQSTPITPNDKKMKPFNVAGPNFQDLAKNAPKGTTVKVIEGDAATVSAFKNALQDPNAAGVFFIGHATGQFDEKGNFSADGLHLADGTFKQEDSVEVQAQTVGIFACDSQATRGFFGLNGKAQSFIGLDSGKNGLTATNDLTQGGFDAARATVKGRGPDQAMTAANGALGRSRVQAPNGEYLNIRQNNLNKGDSVHRVP
jgi:RHS repeat-associated protein